MTTAPLPPPSTCPTSLVAACAPMLGFTPEHCLVAFAYGVPNRTGPVVVRLDLPDDYATEAVAQHAARSIAGTRAVAVDLVAWVDDPDEAPRDEVSSGAFLAKLRAALGRHRVESAVVLSTNGRVWWSHTCSDPGCCPEYATALDQRVAEVVRAEYVYAGYAPLASRAELAQRVAADPAQIEAVRSALTRGQASGTTRWPAAQVDFLDQLLLTPDRCGDRGQTLSAPKVARALRGLGHVRVRDVVLRRLVVSDERCPACWQATMDTLCAALRGAPAGDVAPVATVLALVAWMRGDGALATLCLQRAAEDPGYRLAHLAEALISSGTDPAMWRASLARLSEAECAGVE